MRPEYAPLALAYKERAAYTKDQLLAAMPAGPYAHQYIFLDFPKNHGRLLMARPGDDEPARSGSGTPWPTITRAN